MKVAPARILLDRVEGVRHQAACVRELVLPVHSDLTLGVDQFHDASALRDEERRGEDTEHVGALGLQQFEGGDQIFRCSRLDHPQVQSEFRRCLFQIRGGSVCTKGRFVGSYSSATREAEGNTSLSSCNVLI